MEAAQFPKTRRVLKQILAQEQSEGDGALVRRSIGGPQLKQFDPFLLLDYFTVSPPAGFPDHPHRGFETVTYMLEVDNATEKQTGTHFQLETDILYMQGAFTHQDFAGHKGTIRAGDLQWMTAGRGIVHCEMPATSGIQCGLQLWVNLASKYKMIEPNYQELQKSDILVAEKDGVKVAVIAGESLGVKSPVYTRTPTMYLDITLSPGANFHQAIPEGWNALIYTLEGEAAFGTSTSPAVGSHYTLVLGPGNGVSIWNVTSKLSRFVLIAGQPINEPVVQYGPFVMNTKEEILQAIDDFTKHRNGFEGAVGWKSDPIALQSTSQDCM